MNKVDKIHCCYCAKLNCNHGGPILFCLDHHNMRLDGDICNDSRFGRIIAALCDRVDELIIDNDIDYAGRIESNSRRDDILSHANKLAELLEVTQVVGADVTLSWHEDVDHALKAFYKCRDSCSDIIV